MPKTQSALLEAMAEQQVTVDGETRPPAGPVPPARDREPDRVRGDVPASRGAARPLLPEHGARLSGRGGRARASSMTSATSIRYRPRAGRRRGGGRRRSSMPSKDVYVDPLARALDRRPRPRDARDADGVAVGASVRGSLALERAVRAWALLRRPRLRRRPRTSSGSSCRCSCTASSSPRRPCRGARSTGWEPRSAGFRRECLAARAAARRLTADEQHVPSARRSLSTSPTSTSRSSRAGGWSASAFGAHAQRAPRHGL